MTGWWFQPLWKIWKSVGMIIPNIWKNKKNVPSHQPHEVHFLAHSHPDCWWFNGHQEIRPGMTWIFLGTLGSSLKACLWWLNEPPTLWNAAIHVKGSTRTKLASGNDKQFFLLKKARQQLIYLFQMDPNADSPYAFCMFTRGYAVSDK